MRDQEVIDNLKMVGVDAEKPREIEFFVYFPSEKNATNAAKALTDRGFQASVSPPIRDEEWKCLATILMMPDVVALIRLRGMFEQLVEPLEGEYDGWGTCVPPEELEM